MPMTLDAAPATTLAAPAAASADGQASGV